MRIMVVSSAFYPDNYHINQIVKDLGERGHTVKVLTGQPDYATGYVPKEYKWFPDLENFRISDTHLSNLSLSRYIPYK